MRSNSPPGPCFLQVGDVVRLRPLVNAVAGSIAYGAVTFGPISYSVDASGRQWTSVDTSGQEETGHAGVTEAGPMEASQDDRETAAAGGVGGVRQDGHLEDPQEIPKERLMPGQVRITSPGDDPIWACDMGNGPFPEFLRAGQEPRLEPGVWRTPMPKPPYLELYAAKNELALANATIKRLKHDKANLRWDLSSMEKKLQRAKERAKALKARKALEAER